MKKTISIQISGIHFYIDEDAYERLDRYLQSIRRHFAGLEDRDEIVSDIESRIAEQFAERLSKSKQVIGESDVNELIATMGTVKDIAEYEGVPHVEEMEIPESAEGGRTASVFEGFFRGRRLYRDPDDQVIAGVASGLAKYFGIDPVIVRILFVIFAFWGGFGILAYIVLWIAVPEARTLTEKVDMEGEPVTLSNVQEKIQESTRTFEVGGFTAVRFGGAMRVTVSHGEFYRVAARGPQRDLRDIAMEVQNGELTVRRANSRWFQYLFRGFGAVSIDIVMPALERIRIEGASRAEVSGFDQKDMHIEVNGASRLEADVKVKELEASVDGASRLSVRGKGEDLKLRVNGASRADLGRFAVETADVDVNGASRADVKASKTIGGTVNGASRLVYDGAAKSHVKATGAGSVHRRGSADHDTDDTPSQAMRHTVHEAQARIASTIPSQKPGVLRKAGSGIGSIIVTLLQVFIRLVGVFVSIGAAIGLAALVVGTVAMVFTGGAPYFDVSPLTIFGAPFYYILLAAGFVLVFVPLVLLAQLGGVMASFRNSFSLAGTVTLIAFWLIALMTIGVSGATVWPQLEDRANQLRMVGMQEATRTFSASGEALRVGGGFDISVHQGEEFSITATGPERALQRLRIEENGTVIDIGHRSREHFFCLFCGIDRVSVAVTMPSLAAVSVGGSSSVVLDGFNQESIELIAHGSSSIRGTLNASSLVVELTGASNANITGTGTDLRASLSGASKLWATEYAVQSVSAELSGASRIDVDASQSITGELHGASNLYYREYPDVSVQVSTSGSSGAYPADSASRADEEADWQPVTPAEPETEFEEPALESI